MADFKLTEDQLKTLDEKIADNVIQELTEFSQGLTELENKVLTEICYQLETWRDGEPGYSCIDGSDITRELKLKPKVVAGVISSLCKKGYVYSEDGGDFNGILYPDWRKIPNNFGRAK
jgi:DNA-binding MarR family transcriptional regulator